jgi:hypothetical protein
MPAGRPRWRHVDVVIVRDIDRLARNLTDWNAFEKARVRLRVRLSAYTWEDLDLFRAEGAYYGGMKTLRARRDSAERWASSAPACRTAARSSALILAGGCWSSAVRSSALIAVAAGRSCSSRPGS